MREYSVRTPNGVNTIQLSDDEARKRGLFTSAENPDAPLKARSRADEARAAAAKAAFSRED